MHNITKLLFIFFSLIFLGTISVQADSQERILNFHSDIDVDTAGRVLVTETIRINVTGESIGRGIVRSLPIYRKDRYGNKKRIDVNILSVKRDGEDETYMTKFEDNDFAVYIGDADHYLSPAVYTYTIRYESYGHVGFFDDYDEIYWNVTGNDWAFRIDSASATVHVLPGTKIINNACYTGSRGSKDSNCSYNIVGDSIINYQSNGSLDEKEGLTIATSFTPNIIKRPPPPSQFSIFYQTYYYLITLGGGFLVLIGYFVHLFKKFGNKAKKPVVIPTFNPPAGKSPGSIRYLFKKKVDEKALTASLISMAVKGAITIQNNKADYTITKKDKIDQLSSEEQKIYVTLFSGKEIEIQLKKKYTSLWSKVYNGFESVVKKKDNIKDYFPSRAKCISTGVLLSLFLVVVWLSIASFSGKIGFEGIMSISMLSFFTILILLTIFNVGKSFLLKIFMILFAIPLIIAQVTIAISDESILRYSLIFIYGLVLLNILFIKFFSIKTQKGLDYSAELEGFEMYLKTAEESRLNFLTPPDDTPEQFEKILPYAVALDLEIQWSKKFSKILKQYNYEPTWCVGTPIVSYVDFTRSLSGSMTSRVINNVTPPATSSGSSSGSGGRSSGGSSWSSGSSGGGFSGGGGGGGGGRGW